MPKFPLSVSRICTLTAILLSSSCSDNSNRQTGTDFGLPLKINGSTTVNPPVAEAAEILRSRKGLQIQVDTQGGSSGGISTLGEGLVQLGMTSRAIRTEDRKKFPDCDFREIRIGEDAVALIVSRDVWESGVTSISKSEMKGIYEGSITNWNQLGGEDRKIAFFNKEPGRGTWEVFANWAYGDHHKSPQVSFPEVGGNEETRNKVSTTRGAISQLSSSWADNESVFALGIETETDETVFPTGANIVSRAYPMSRPLHLLTNGDPVGSAKVMIDFILGEEGQQLVRKHGYLALADLEE